MWAFLLEVIRSMQLTILVISFAIMSQCIAVADEYKYYSLDKLRFFDKILYTDKKVHNELTIGIINGGCISIRIIVLAPDEYTESEANREKSRSGLPEPSIITLNIRGKSVSAKYTDMGNNICNVYTSEFRQGFGIFISYFGVDDLNLYLMPVLNELILSSTINELGAHARIERDIVKCKVSEFTIPVYNNALISENYSSEISKDLTFQTDCDNKEIARFYSDILNSKGWSLHESRHNYYVWVDDSEELMLALFIKQPMSSDTENSTVILKLYPFMQDLSGFCQIGLEGKNRDRGNE